MEIIQHILGVCPDAHSHFDLSNLIANFNYLHDVWRTIYFFLKKIVNFFI